MVPESRVHLSGPSERAHPSRLAHARARQILGAGECNPSSLYPVTLQPAPDERLGALELDALFRSGELGIPLAGGDRAQRVGPGRVGPARADVDIEVVEP